MDIQGILGIDSGEVRNGDGEIRSCLRSMPTTEGHRALCCAPKTLSVFDIITNPTNVVVEVR
jgi:hypothetical protein